MNLNNLSNIFSGVAAKRLTAVEVEPKTSNQHEFQGISRLREILDKPNGKAVYPAKFLLLHDDDESVTLNTELTWYDSRANQPLRSPEYRLYYPSQADQILKFCNPGDLVVFGLHNDKTIYVFLARKGSVFENQLLWLFGIDNSSGLFTRSDLSEKQLLYAARFILEKVGIETNYYDEFWIKKLLSKFPDKFPSTFDFSEFARETISNIDPLNNPDDTLMDLIEHEEMLFRTYEKHEVDQILRQPFKDTDSFIQTALSVINRRKARAGASLENQIEFILSSNSVKYTRKNKTENKASPDFLFPGNKEYSDLQFDSTLLSMLGVKRTCKDRWRQILSEADRIQTKHLFTLEPGISSSQTNEMIYHKVQLVLPQKLHETYSDFQRSNIFNLHQFIDEIKKKQSSYPKL